MPRYKYYQKYIKLLRKLYLSYTCGININYICRTAV